MKTRIPDRWEPYQALGQRIPGTRFISFKVPLRDDFFRRMPAEIRFTPEMLMEKCPTLQFIVDLTNTKRYYNGKVFTDRGLQYRKILTPGHVIPDASYVQKFFDTVDSFLTMPSSEPDSLIGVHCTHGLNRTSYFICSYMIHRMGFTPKDAIEAFEVARGHKIERDLYIEDLLKGGMGSKKNDGTVRRSQPTPRCSSDRDINRRSRGDAHPPPPASHANPYVLKRPRAHGHLPYGRHNHSLTSSQPIEKTSSHVQVNRPPQHHLQPPAQPYVLEYSSHSGGSHGFNPNWRNFRMFSGRAHSTSSYNNDEHRGRGRSSNRNQL